MKNLLLALMILISAEFMFSQKVVLHRNAGGNETFQLSSVDSITFVPFACGDEIRYEGQNISHSFNRHSMLDERKS